MIARHREGYDHAEDGTWRHVTGRLLLLLMVVQVGLLVWLISRVG